MLANPFPYQRPLPPSDLIDRAGELDALQRAASDRVAVRLSSPRRFGKTSLIHAHLASMAAAGHRTAFVDFDRVATLADVADRLVDGLASLPVDPERRLDRRLARLGVQLGTRGLNVQLAPRAPVTALSADQARAVIRDLLALPGELAADGTLTVLAFDEFQDLLTADRNLDGLLRSVLQHQEDVAYVFAGSSPTLMRALFADRERPFFGQARPLEVPPLPEDETVSYVLARLPEHPAAADAGVAVVALAAGHPQRTMLLAHHLYDRLDRGSGPEDPEALGRAVLEDALGEVEDVFVATWQALEPTARAVVTVLADGLSPTSSRAAEQHALARSTLQGAAERMERDGQLVARRDGRLVLLDPLLAEWLRRR